MKVGVIGTGWMGKNHIRVYSDLRGVEEIHITDIDGQVAREAAKEFQVQTAADIEELLDKVDAVSVCVPTAKHLEIVEKVLKKGVHCLLEKPVASNPEEAGKIAEWARKSKAVVGVGHIERFNPVIREMKRILERPLYVEMERHNPHFGRITDADAITDLMIHDIDVLWNDLFAGRKYRILGAGGVRKKLIELAVALVDFEGAIVKLSASRLSAKKTRQILVEEEEKTLLGDLMTQEIYIHKKPRPLEEIENTKYSQESVVDKVLVSKIEPLREELKTFLDCARSGRPFPIPVADGVRALEVAEEIRNRVVASS